MTPDLGTNARVLKDRQTTTEPRRFLGPPNLVEQRLPHLRQQIVKDQTGPTQMYLSVAFSRFVRGWLRMRRKESMILVLDKRNIWFKRRPFLYTAFRLIRDEVAWCRLGGGATTDSM